MSAAPDAESESEREPGRDWLRLMAAPGLSVSSLRTLAAAVGGPGRLLRTPLAEIRSLGGASVAAALGAIPDGVETPALRWREQASGRFIVGLDDSRYPDTLRSLHDAPLVLFVEGPPEVLAGLHLAVVGSRHPTRTGLDNAKAFARDLAGAGLGIVSGLADGIDAAAHSGALDAAGTTVAVLGHGPDRVYPRVNAPLARAIVAAGGALVSEFMPGVPPRRGNFPRRNRLISGLSRGVLVVEAAVRSGSLITARSALEQGREVFAVPGSIHNPMARGCHRLIRDGAKLVETTTDILEELGLQSGAASAAAGVAASAPPAGLDDEYVTLLQALGHDPVSVDVLVERTGLTPQVLSSMLLQLELKGVVSPVRGGRYVRRKEG
jgi:DNA processing protein